MSDDVAHGTSPTPSAAGARLTAVFAGGLPAVGLGLLALATVEAAEPAVVAGLRYTARWSFALFLAFYVAAALDRTVPWRDRTGALFTAFASAHLVHLGLIFDLAATADESPFGPAALIGGTGYAFLAATTALSLSPRAVADARFARLERATRQVLWVVFALFYVSRTVAGRAHAPVLLAALLAALGVELWGRRRALASAQAA